MKGIIKDNGREFTYENLNFIRIQDKQLVINYQDENDEECEEIGDIPEFLKVTDKFNTWDKLENYLRSAEDALYPDNLGRRASRCLFTLVRNNITSIKQLNDCKINELKNIKGFGKVSLDIAVEAMYIYREETNAN